MSPRTPNWPQPHWISRHSRGEGVGQGREDGTGDSCLVDVAEWDIMTCGIMTT